MSEESVAIAALDRRVEKVEDAVEPMQTLLATKHTHGNKLQEHAGKLQEHAGKLQELEVKSSTTERDMGNLSEKVSTGFLDLKEVIVHRAEQDAEDRKRQHELAVTAAADSRALWMKALGLVATALTIAGGGGSVLYSMSADPPERPPVEAAP